MKHSYDRDHSAEFQRRHDALVCAIRKDAIDHFVVTTTENIFYLTGATFEPLERPFFLVIGADGSRRMLVPVLELDHMAKAWGIDAACLTTYREFPAPPGDGWSDRLLDGTYLPGAFGFEGGTPWHVAEPMRREGGQACDLLEPLRVVKSEWEVAQVERAARYADWGVLEILRRAWNGATVAETYMATQALQRKIIREVPGWDALATKIIAAAWPAPLSAEPHAVPSLHALLRAGPHVALVVSRVNGYTAESERTFFTASPSSEEKEKFELMTRAREIAFAMLQPGVACCEIDGAVNEFLGEHGFQDFRTRLHRCGHGFGLGNHEAPWLAVGSRHVLEKNMIVSIEPGLYLRGVGGYRHSDTVLVTDSSYRCLTRAPTRLHDLVLRRGSIRHRLTSWAVRRTLGLRAA